MSEWLPMEDLAYTNNGDPILVLFSTGSMMIGYVYARDILTDAGYLKDLPVTPTHWLPIPELPVKVD